VFERWRSASSADERATDGVIHDVGTGWRADCCEATTPSLVGVHDKPLLLHDGRPVARTV
jgi:hypothetical protein